MLVNIDGVGVYKHEKLGIDNHYKAVERESRSARDGHWYLLQFLHLKGMLDGFLFIGYSDLGASETMARYLLKSIPESYGTALALSSLKKMKRLLEYALLKEEKIGGLAAKEKEVFALLVKAYDNAIDQLKKSELVH